VAGQVRSLPPEKFVLPLKTAAVSGQAMCSAVGIQHVCVYQQALTGQRLKSTLLLKQFAISIEGRRHRLLVLPRDRHSRPFSTHIQELSIQETEADKQRNRGEHDLQSANSVFMQHRDKRIVCTVKLLCRVADPAYFSDLPACETLHN